MTISVNDNADRSLHTMTVDCPVGAENKARLNAHDQRFVDQSHAVEKLSGSIDRLTDKLEGASSRPSWLVTTIISFLVALVCIMGTTLFSNKQRSNDPKITNIVRPVERISER